MNGWQIGLTAWLALGALLQVALIGKERKPNTPGQAAIYLVITAALIYVVVKGMNTAGIAVVVIGVVIAAVTLAGTAITRWVIREDYKVTLTGPSLKVEKRSLPAPKTPAPRVLILPGDGVPDRLDRDYVVTEARSR